MEYQTLIFLRRKEEEKFSIKNLDGLALDALTAVHCSDIMSTRAEVLHGLSSSTTQQSHHVVLEFINW